MKLSFKKDELLKKLAGVKSIAEAKGTMPILSHFLLTAGKERCSIQATDLELHLRESLEAAVEEPGTICLPGHKFFEIVKEIDGDIALQSEDGNWMRVKAKASNFRIACLPADDFPAWPSPEGEELKIRLNAKGLAGILAKTLYAAGESDNRYTLNGILFHVNPEAKSLSFVGTDGHRMALMTIPLTGVDKEIKAIIPRKHLSELKKFLSIEGDVLIKFSKNNVLFDFGDKQLFSRLIEGNYPNYTQVMPAINGNRLLLEKESFAKALRRASIISSKHIVTMEVKEGNLAVSCSEAETGEARDEISVDYLGEDIKIGFNSEYLLDSLGAIENEKVVLSLQDPLAPALLVPEGDTMYQCVIMPIRIG